MRKWIPALTLSLFALFCFPHLLRGETSDVGDVSFPNSGAPEAQSSFQRGLALLHNFEYEDAAEQFAAAEKIDPGFAMAYWGEAMTYNHPIWMQQDRDAALAVLKRLGATSEERVAKAPTEREKGYLQAIEILYGDGDKDLRDFAYAEAMKHLHQTYPQDSDAAAFYALSLLGTAHKGRDFAIYMKAAGILEDVFHEHPNHPGAVHYLIHCYDDPIHAPLGLRPARVYSKIAPSAGHAQHMTSHIYIALGMWDEVVAANEIAVSVAIRDSRRRHKPYTGCGHYETWLEYGYLQQGRLQKAREVMNVCRQSVANIATQPQTMSSMKGMGGKDQSLSSPLLGMWSRYLLDSCEWKGDVAGWTISPGDDTDAAILVDFTSGFVAAQTSNTEALRKAQERLDQDVHKYSQDSKEEDEVEPERHRVLQLQLSALNLNLSGKSDAAIALLREAASIEESMPIDFGPPAVMKPTRELLGEMLLKLNRPIDAKKEFTSALARAPRRTASLLGLMRAASLSGDAKAAEETRAQLRSILRQADNPPSDISD